MRDKTEAFDVILSGWGYIIGRTHLGRTLEYRYDIPEVWPDTSPS